MTFAAVLFDLGQTLLNYGPHTRWPQFRVERMQQLYPLVSDLFGPPALAPADFGRLVGAALQTDELRAREHGGAAIPFAHRLRAALAIVGIEADGAPLDQLIEAFNEPIRDWPHPFPETEPVLAQLRSLGLKLAIITNTPWDTPGHLLRSDLKRWGLTGFLDAFIASGEVPWRKPNPRFMWAAADALATPRDRCLVVGDNLMADIAGARAAAMRSVWMNRESLPLPPDGPRPDWTAASLEEVVRIVQDRG